MLIMADKINQILKEVLIKINPEKEELDSVNEYLKKFILQFEKQLKKSRIRLMLGCLLAVASFILFRLL